MIARGGFVSFSIVAKLHSMEVFRYCCPFQNSLQHELSLIIKVRIEGDDGGERCAFSIQAGTIEWLDRMVVEVMKPGLRVRD